MKKALFVIVCSIMTWSLHAQEQQAKVVLKNGTELIGMIVSIDPSDGVRINIAGIENEIKMSEVTRIESILHDTKANDDHSYISSEYKKVCRLAEGSSTERAFSEHLTLKYGSLDCFLNKKRKFQAHLEFPELKIEGLSFDEYASGREASWKDVFNKETDEALEMFIAKWNKKVAGICGTEDQADLTMNLFITELDLGSSAAAIWGMRTVDGGAAMSGYLELVDNNTNEVLSIIRISGIRGLGNNGIIFYKEGNRLKKVFEKLAIKMAEDIQ